MTTYSLSSTTSARELARRALVDGTWITLRLAGLSLLRGRRGIALAALCLIPLVPVAFALFTDASGGKGGLGYVDAYARFFLRWVVPVVCLYVGCAALGEEIEGRTLP